MSDFSQPLVQLPTGGVISPVGPSHSDPFYNDCIAALYSTTTTAWTTANQAVYQAVLVPDTVTVTHMGVVVGTSSSGNIDVGIYTERGTCLVSAGSTAVSTAGSLQSFDLTDTLLTPGIYWLACAVDNTTASFRGSPAPISAASAATARTRGMMIQASAFPLPATATFAAPAGLVFTPIVTAYLRTTF